MQRGLQYVFVWLPCEYVCHARWQGVLPGAALVSEGPCAMTFLEQVTFSSTHALPELLLGTQAPCWDGR
jgi:hypothetical protein